MSENGSQRALTRLHLLGFFHPILLGLSKSTNQKVVSIVCWQLRQLEQEQTDTYIKYKYRLTAGL